MSAEKSGTVVAIDGPAGAGKSTLAHRLAEALGLPFVTTGVMYRALAQEALRRGVDVGDGEALAGVAATIDFSLGGDPPELLVDGWPPDEMLSTSQIESVVSEVARHPEVRSVLRAEQRRLGAPGGVVEGRDIGTVVFPDADVKIFVQADPKERARRRQAERGSGSELAEALARRDRLDAKTNPLVPASDATLVDTTGREIEEVFSEVLALVREALGR